MTFLEIYAPWASLIGIFSALFLGYLIGYGRHKEARRHSGLLFLLNGCGWSLQCVQGINGDDHQWAVTDGQHKMVGSQAFTPQDAISSALDTLLEAETRKP